MNHCPSTGPGANDVAIPVQAMAAHQQQLVVSWGSDSPQLSSAEYFVRTQSNLLDGFEAMLAVCKRIGVGYISFLTDKKHEPLQASFAGLVQQKGGFKESEIGGDWEIAASVIVDPLDVEDACTPVKCSRITQLMNQLEYGHSRFTFIISETIVLQAVLNAVDDEGNSHPALGKSSAGRGWMAPAWVLEQLGHSQSAIIQMQGWMTTAVSVDAASVQYTVLSTRWNSSAGGLVDYTTTKDKTVAAWNAVLAVVHGIDELFREEVLPYDNTFRQRLFEVVRHSSCEGAGLPIRFNQTTGNPQISSDILNVQPSSGSLSSQLVHVGTWSPFNSTSQNPGSLALNLSAVEWPGSQVPRDLTCRVTLGFMFRNQSTCKSTNPCSTDPLVLGAIEMAQNEINQRTDMIKNCTLHINTTRYEDTSDLIRRASGMLQVKGRTAVVAMIAAETSEQSAVLNPVMTMYKVPQISYSSAGVALNDAGGFVRTCPSDTQLLTATARLINKLRFQQVILISAEWARGGVAFLTDTASTYGYEVFNGLDDVVPYTDMDRAKAVTALTSAVKSSFTKVFILLLTNKETWPMIRAANDAGYVGPGYTWINAHTQLTVPASDGLTDWPRLARGMVCIHQEVSNSNTWTEFNTKMNETFGSDATFASAYAYDAIYLVARQITTLIEDSSPKLEVFSENGAGLLQNPILLSNALNSTSFSSVFQQTATISATDLSPISTIIVENYHYNPQTTASGSWAKVGELDPQDGILNVTVKDMQFSDGTNIPPFSSSKVSIGVLVADAIEGSDDRDGTMGLGFAYARGGKHTQTHTTECNLSSKSFVDAEVRPAALAAQAYIESQNHKILNGYDMQVNIADTGCNAGRALFAYVTLQKDSPIGVVGGGCDASTIATQIVAGSSKQVPQLIPMILALQSFLGRC